MWFEGWDMAALSPVGWWLLLGIVFLPVYGMLLGWFLGKPRNFRLALTGVGYLVGITVALWGGLFLLTQLIGVAFFGGQ